MFKSDESVGGDGFDAVYTTHPVTRRRKYDCGGTVTLAELSGTIGKADGMYG